MVDGELWPVEWDDAGVIGAGVFFFSSEGLAKRKFNRTSLVMSE